MSLEGKTAIVTGASSGIGAATALTLARAGARVVGGARRTERVAELGEGIVALELDVRDEPGCERFVEQAVAELGALDILVNNAGLALGREPFWEVDDADTVQVMETNVDGLMRMTKLCLEHIRDGGHIVNLGSVAGRQAYDKGASYIASKFAVRGFTYALRQDLLGRPIHVSTVDPGLVGGTEFSPVRFHGDLEKAAKVYEDVHPLSADDVAECILFVVTRPPHVNIDELVVMALAQSSAVRIHREDA